MTHSPPSVVSCPSLTCQPSWSRCQGSLTTWWPSSLHLKCASENRMRDLRRPCSSLWHSSRRIPAPPIRQSDDSLMRGSGREPHHEIGLLALQPARSSGAAGQYLAQTEAEDFRFLSPRVALHARPWPEMA